MTRYDAYLLRIWRGDRADDARWAGRLEHLPDGQQQRFGSLEELLAHLRRVLDEERSGTGLTMDHERLATE